MICETPCHVSVQPHLGKLKQHCIPSMSCASYWRKELAYSALLTSRNISSHTLDGVALSPNPSSTQSPEQCQKLPQGHLVPLCLRDTDISAAHIFLLENALIALLLWLLCGAEERGREKINSKPWRAQENASCAFPDPLQAPCPGPS